MNALACLIDEEDLREAPEPEPSGPRLLGPVRRLHLVEEAPRPAEEQATPEEALLRAVGAAGSMSEAGLTALGANRAGIRELVARGLLRELDLPAGGKRWRLAAPRRGWMRLADGDRREDCVRYADCLHVAATAPPPRSRYRHGDPAASCPPACAHYAAIPREQRLAEATVRRYE